MVMMAVTSFAVPMAATMAIRVALPMTVTTTPGTTRVGELCTRTGPCCTDWTATFMGWVAVEPLPVLTSRVTTAVRLVTLVTEINKWNVNPFSYSSMHKIIDKQMKKYRITSDTRRDSPKFWV